MALITWSTVVVACSAGLSDVDPVAQTVILDRIHSMALPAGLDGEDGPQTRAARIYLAAHEGALVLRAAAGSGSGGGSGGTTGAITSESVGEISRSFGDSSSGGGSGGTSVPAPYNATVFGSMYWAIIRGSSKIRLPTVG